MGDLWYHIRQFLPHINYQHIIQLCCRNKNIINRVVGNVIVKTKSIIQSCSDWSWCMFWRNEVAFTVNFFCIGCINTNFNLDIIKFLRKTDKWSMQHKIVVHNLPILWYGSAASFYFWGWKLFHKTLTRTYSISSRNAGMYYIKQLKKTIFSLHLVVTSK